MNDKKIIALLALGATVAALNISNSIEYRYTKSYLLSQEKQDKIQAYYKAIDIAFSKCSLLETILLKAGQKGGALDYMKEKQYYSSR